MFSSVFFCSVETHTRSLLVKSSLGQATTHHCLVLRVLLTIQEDLLADLGVKRIQELHVARVVQMCWGELQRNLVLGVLVHLGLNLSGNLRVKRIQELHVTRMVKLCWRELEGNQYSGSLAAAAAMILASLGLYGFKFELPVILPAGAQRPGFCISSDGLCSAPDANSATAHNAAPPC